MSVSKNGAASSSSSSLLFAVFGLGVVADTRAAEMVLAGTNIRALCARGCATSVPMPAPPNPGTPDKDGGGAPLDVTLAATWFLCAPHALSTMLRLRASIIASADNMRNTDAKCA